jgi:putative ABC transport system substrate-binding protein
MRRRDLAALLATGLTARHCGAAGQTPPAHIGYLWLGSPGSDGTTRAGLLKGLAERGYVEGTSISIDYRYAGGDERRLAPLFAELLAAKPALLVVPGVVATRAAQLATASVPIVSVTTDPVSAGFATSLAVPGRNVTGMAVTAGAEIAEKLIELAREVVPNAQSIAVLHNPLSSVSVANAQGIHLQAERLGIALSLHGVSNQQELAGVLDRVVAAKPQVLIVDADALLYANSRLIVAFARDHRLPTVYALREFVDAGGLLSYGASIFDLWRRAAKHIDQILKGGNPAEIPIEQPTKFELVINAKTAKDLGISLSPLLLARADEVIE